MNNYYIFKPANIHDPSLMELFSPINLDQI